MGLPPGASKEVTSSAPFGGTFPLGGGRLRAHQDSHRKRWLRKPRRMSGTAPATIFANLGPSGPGETANRHSDFARRKFCRAHQECVPRNGVRGKATMSTKCSSGAVPGDPLVSFPSLGKKLAAGAAKSLRIQQTQSKICPLIRPSVRTGAPSPQGEGLLRYPFENKNAPGAAKTAGTGDTFID